MKAILLSCLALLAAAAPVEPPWAQRRSHQVRLHGETIEDPYFWLRDKKDPEVKTYLDAENAYTDSVMAPSKKLAERLYKEMLSRIKETDSEVPYPERGYFYYSRTRKGKQYPIFCRKKGSLKSKEEVLLDVNALAKGQKFMDLGLREVSDDNRLLAYSTDNVGFRQYTLAVKDLSTGQVLPWKAERVTSAAWAGDNRILFYTIENDAKRSYRVYRHELGSSGPDALVFEEKDDRFYVGVGRTRSRAYLLILCGSMTATEARLLPAEDPKGDWRLIAKRRPDHEYYPNHREDRLYIRTNDKGRNFRLVWAPVSDPREKNWEEAVPHRSNVMLEGHELFKDRYVLVEREEGLPQFTVGDFRTGGTRRVAFPEPAYTAWPRENREFDSAKFRYAYQSPLTPETVYDYDMASGKAKPLKRKEVPGYDPRRYRLERAQAVAADGTRVPVSLLYRKEFKRNGKAPIHLYAYGAYGYPTELTFNPNIFSLVDRGAVSAQAHIRGGGEMGKAWHDQGRMMNKKNTFTDFIAAGEHLLKGKYGRLLVIEGGSAGGLLMGAVTNMRPELFRAIVSHVPFVDVINTMLDESLPLTVTEFEEWGNPKKKADYAYMRSYSPYDNLEAKAYPAILVKTSFHDSQVMYWEPAKYVAKLRPLKTDKNPLLLKTNMAAGHGGSSGRYDHLRENAFDYSFILWQMGLAGR